MTSGERRLRTLAGIVSERRADIPAHGLPVSLLADLKAQIGCDVISFEGFDSDQRLTWFAEAIRGQEVSTVNDVVADAFEPAHWQHCWDCQPCSYPDRTGDLRTVITIGDFYSIRQWHGTGMYTDLYRPKGYEHELMLTLPASPGAGTPYPSSRPGNGTCWTCWPPGTLTSRSPAGLASPRAPSASTWRISTAACRSRAALQP